MSRISLGICCFLRCMANSLLLLRLLLRLLLMLFLGKLLGLLLLHVFWLVLRLLLFDALLL